MSKVEGGGGSPIDACNYFFFEASMVKRER